MSLKIGILSGTHLGASSIDPELRMDSFETFEEAKEMDKLRKKENRLEQLSQLPQYPQYREAIRRLKEVKRRLIELEARGENIGV